MDSQNLKGVYMTAEEAKVEIWKRWNDKKLRKKVDEFWGENRPSFIGNEPLAFLVRYIISPDMEFEHFLKLIDKIGLNPLLCEYSNDKLVAKNLDKYHLCKLFFYDKNKYSTLKNEGDLPKIKIIDFNKSEGKNLNEINTIWGERLIDFHHDLLKNKFPDKADKICDISEWFKKTRFLTEYYYLYYLSLFICHGILFENILLTKGEKAFSEKKILPGFYKLQEIFGVKPIIVPLVPENEADDLRWWLYSNDTKIFVDNYVKDFQKIK